MPINELPHYCNINNISYKLYFKGKYSRCEKCEKCQIIHSPDLPKCPRTTPTNNTTEQNNTTDTQNETSKNQPKEKPAHTLRENSQNET